MEWTKKSIKKIICSQLGSCCLKNLQNSLIVIQMFCLGFFYLSIKETFLRKLKRFTRKLKILANLLLYKSFRKFHRVSIHSFEKQEQIAVKLSRIIYLFKRIFHIFLFFYMKM